MPDVLDVIKGRRSIRKFKGEAIPEDILLKLFDAARWAPSWANTQCWEFIVIEDSKIKEELAKTLIPDRNPAKEAVKTAPIVIAALGKKGVSGYYKGSPVTNKGDWLMFDVALAIQNMVLEAHSLGLGTVIVGALDFDRAKQILKVPDDRELVALIPIGYPAEIPKPPIRKEISDFIYYNEYSKKKL